MVNTYSNSTVVYVMTTTIRKTLDQHRIFLTPRRPTSDSGLAHSSGKPGSGSWWVWKVAVDDNVAGVDRFAGAPAVLWCYVHDLANMFAAAGPWLVF